MPDQRSHRWQEHTVAADESGRTVQEILTGPLGVSRRMIQRLTRSRGIRLNRRATHLSRTVRPGDVVAARVAPDEDPGVPPVEMPLEIVYEDGDVLVVDKPAGLLVHPLSPRHTRTLAHGIAHHYARIGLRSKVRPVHRLDRDTSGALLIAKSAAAHAGLDRQLRAHQLRREYLALVAGVVVDDEGTITAPIGAHPRHPHLRAVRPEGQSARTDFTVVERFTGASLLRLRLETGRTHQIRVHLAHLGHAILGDLQYGGRAVPGLERPALHAWHLAFHHPTTGAAVEVEVPLPPDLAASADRLRSGAP